MKEQQKHIDAYNQWFALLNSGMPVTDAVNTVASKLNVTDTSVFRWMKAFDWKGRAAIDTHDVQTKTKEKINGALADNKARYLMNLHDAMEDAEKRKTITIENMNDYEKATKLALTIQGDDHENSGETNELLREVIRTLRESSIRANSIGVKSSFDDKD
jgi:hypothetical protein